MTVRDPFVDLARFYDPIMGHVDYDRWYLITGLLAEMLPSPFKHLDVACGTGILMKKLRIDRWQSFGVDLSMSMLRAGKKDLASWPVAAGDLRTLPFYRSFNYITCLFDSVNFLLKNADLEAGLRSMGDALAPGGLLYFDVVTERMVLEHFAGQRWTERNGKFATTWECDYDHSTLTVETRIRVNSGQEYTLYERVYEEEEIVRALAAAGVQLLGAFDAENWRAPRRKTIRIDFVGAKGDARLWKSRFRGIRARIQKLLH